MQYLREKIFTDKAELELKLAKEISKKLEQEIKIKVKQLYLFLAEVLLKSYMKFYRVKT